MPERHRINRHALSVLALLVPVLFAGALHSQAQNITPLPETLIFSTSAEPIFPQAVRLTVGVRSPANEIARVNLTIKPSDEPVVEVPINIAESITYQTVDTELAYVWQIPDTVSLPAFGEVAFAWRVITTRNMNAIRESRFTFADARVGWQDYTDPAGRINLTVRAGSGDPARLRDGVSDVYDLLSQNVGATPAFNFVVYPRSVPIDPCVDAGDGQFIMISDDSKTEVPCQPGRAESVYRASGYIPISEGVLNQREAVVEALVKGFYAPLWQEKAVPQWFQSGLAQFYVSETSRAALLEANQIAVRTGNLLSLDQMAVEPPSDPVRQDLWRAQSFGMVAYLADQIGMTEIIRFAKDLGSAPSFNAALEGAAGPVQGLIPGWSNWIFKSAAQAVFDSSFVQPQTSASSP